MSLFLHSALLPDFVSFVKRKATPKPYKKTAEHSELDSWVALVLVPTPPHLQ